MDQYYVDFLERLGDLIVDFRKTFEGLPAEALDWVPGPDMNSLVVLVVHTTSSARFWIGDIALGEPSNRDRAAEFRARGLAADDLSARFDALEAYARRACEQLTLADLSALRAVPHKSTGETAGWALLHALEHTGLHLGHAEITRQLWDQRHGR